MGAPALREFAPVVLVAVAVADQAGRGDGEPETGTMLSGTGARVQVDFRKLNELHDDDLHGTVRALFAEMFREAVYGEHSLPDGVSHLVHYTTLEALISMLGVSTMDGEAYVLATPETGGPADRAQARGYLRLYDTFSANDPNEGTFFVSSADPSHEFREKYPAVWKLFEDRSAAPAYQTSLTQVNNAREADCLVFWRTYGRDGTGCALVFPVELFGGLDNLFRVRYGEEAAMACLTKVSEFLDTYSSEVRGAPDFAGMSTVEELPPPLASALSPLVYLYKSKHYEYEREARVVVPFSDLEHGALLQRGTVSNVTGAWRHFAQLPKLKIGGLLVTGSEVVFGPSVKVSANVEFVLERLLRQRGLYGPKVKPSSISYRP